MKPIRAESLRLMNTLVRHRGPDDEGYVLFKGLDQNPLILGGRDTSPACFQSAIAYAPKDMLPAGELATLGMAHRRLSIIDLAVTGHQPMCSRNNRYWIVYNGEVYNYLELREELKELGYTFISQSDTEVILAAWEYWGESCLNRFNGMFSFAVYDTLSQSISLVRDRFGVKPLYYWVSPSGLVAFASEIKQFTVLPGWSPRLNGQRAYDYLIWGLIDHSGETSFKGVFQLRPGHVLKIHLNTFSHDNACLVLHEPIESAPWYVLEPRAFEGTLDEAAAEFRNIFSDALSLRLRSDVPVGSCLSGGLDSSSIVCMMNRLLLTQSTPLLQKSFSACTNEKQYDEKEFIDEVVNATGLKSFSVYPSLDNLFPSLPDILWHQDEPFGSASIYAQWNVFALASQHGIKVMLDGQGADEHLAGYHTYFAMRQASLMKQLRFIRLLCDLRATRRLHGYTILHSARDMASLLLPVAQRKMVAKIFHTSDLDPPWLSRDLMGAEAENPFSLEQRKPSSVLKLSLLQLRATSLPMLLHWEDRNSMANSIEARIPFLDYRLVEFVLGLPEEYKLKDGITKRVLREAMRGILPEKVRLRRDKIGFATPEQLWLKNYNPQLFRNELRSAVDRSQGILSHAVLGILDEMIDGKRPFSFLVWRMICLGKWIEAFHISV